MYCTTGGLIVASQVKEQKISTNYEDEVQSLLHVEVLDLKKMTLFSFNKVLAYIKYMHVLIKIDSNE